MRSTPPLLIACLLAVPICASATPVSFDTGELVGFRNCIAGPTSACDTLSPFVTSVVGGAPGSTSSTAADSLAGYGTVSGDVSLSGTLGAPIIKASATSAVGTRQSTNSVALESYTYTGTAATTRTFGGTLTYSQTVTGTYPFEVGSGINALIDVFTVPGPTVDVGTTPTDNIDNLFDPTLFAGYTDLGQASYTDDLSNPAGTGTIGVTVTLDPGETVWVWALLQAGAANGGSVDASHTFVTGWDDTIDLTSAVSVPEPATLTLLGLGLLAVAFVQKKTPRNLEGSGECQGRQSIRRLPTRT